MKKIKDKEKITKEMRDGMDAVSGNSEAVKMNKIYHKRRLYAGRYLNGYKKRLGKSLNKKHAIIDKAEEHITRSIGDDR